MLTTTIALRVGVALLAAGCAPRDARARLTGFEDRARRDDETIDALAVRVDAFERDVGRLVALRRRASDELAAAARRFEEVRRIANLSADAYAVARDEYETAARNWRLVTIMILAAATWDYAGHLCGTRMTTGDYRRALRRDGIDLEGLDADHGLPRSLGGADHPLNYEMIDSSLNRSLGNDVLRKLLSHPTHLLQGAAVSALMRLRCSPQL